MHTTPRRLFPCILSRDPYRRVRVGMALLALLLMSSSALVMLFLHHPSANHHLDAVRWWAALSVGGLAVITLLIRTGWSERLRDPSLTLVQMAWTITSGAVAYVLAGEGRGVVPSMLAMILFFGALGLSPRQVVGIGLYAMAAFSVAVVVSPRFYGTTFDVMDGAYAAMILIVLAGCMVVNLRVQQMRQRLDRQRVALAEALAENRALAMRDELTGLYNRRAMVELIQLECRRRRRGQGTLLFAMIDVDHFKRVNDHHGHAMGDHVLRVFADALRANVRETDVLARWGGDEFLLLLSDIEPRSAQTLLERTREAIAALPVPNAPPGLRLSMSAGLALHLPHSSPQETLERADQALYAAKDQGRNRVALAPELQPAPLDDAPAMPQAARA
ncbi:GGDEF domain-containing protein [Diaphorobacter sp. JS3050]|uniref:GGDEF domain-containing protein n=1 Tax=Diaphorobacter sp. JS3050 TaxID=2735554 RepID=UPI0015555732|nr:GGDEF domain-containing protein [Diaphorobacter sp. JS3050]QJY32367.1 GGDEF domain-containing protein [Diaphorobacter sp. JS3050]